MADPQGIATFPGLAQVISAQMTLTHGISPSVCTIQCAPQAATLTSAPGLLRFLFGNVSLRFTDCIIDDFHATIGPQGEVWTLQLLDRRWRWRFATPLSGHYNMRLENGELARSDDPTASTQLFAPSRKTPQELAKLCLDALSEKNANVSELPNNIFPETFWDFANPAEALQQLCESLSCRIVLGLDDRIALRRIGKGHNLPTTDLMEDALSLDLQALPSKIWCVCAMARYQVDFKLEAVGLDTDGQVKPIDKLSYKPASGWSTADLEHFQNIDSNSVTVRDLAKATVFRWYRVLCPKEIPGFGKLAAGINQVVLDDQQVEQTTDAAASIGAGRPVKRNKPAQVHGKWYLGNADLKNTQTDLRPPTSEDMIYTSGFSIDRDRRLVKFTNQVIGNSEHSATSSTPTKVGIQAADLVLRTACTILQDETLGPIRWVRWKETGIKNGAGPHVIRREDLILGSYPKYSNTPGTYRSQVTSGSGMDVTTNVDEINEQADYYINAAMEEFRIKTPQARTYAGLKVINPDGAIQQVAWFVGPQGATTRASRNREQVDLSLSFKERRFYQQVRDTVQQKNAAQQKRDRRRGA